MSAIIGRIHFSGTPVPAEAFRDALDSLKAFGRDGTQAWMDGPLALGHQQLDITPESRYERQPLQKHGLVIVADAIIDNRDELRDRLGIDNPGRATLPDSELIIDAYHRWGAQCVEKLVGDFAFAIWDTHDQSLFCARDHIGARPLYYRHVGDRFLFATAISGLKAFKDVPLAIDERRVASFLRWPFDATEDSFFQDIHPLLPGHWLHVTLRGVKQHAYWQPDDASCVRYSCPADYADHFRALLETAVSDRIRTPYPIGSHISGGLDSTGVTILANRCLNRQGRTLKQSYSWAPPISATYPLAGGRRDERQLIDQVCRQEGFTCHFGAASGHDYRDFLSRDVAEEGTTDLFEERPVMAHAGQEGIRTMLSGWGGDEAVTFGIRGYAAYLFKRGQWRELFAMTRVNAGGCRHPRRMARFLWQQALLPMMPDPVYERFSPFRETERLNPFLRGDFLKRHPHINRQRMPAWREYPDPHTMQALLLRNGHLASRMATWAKWSAPHDIVYRYPLTDIRLLRFTLGLPPELLWQHGKPRALYRRALNDLLPQRVGKHDPVNERKRMELRKGCWQLLAQEAQEGGFRDHCDWLNTRALRPSIQNTPNTMTMEHLSTFIPICSALQMWHLWQRYMIK
ncbi:asparagine synthase-related protein [Aidingimonas lacisalsi]|uniref:asparagine synthase-related protein n=1 Tax=Aidingimonas lacisalsi TaxID=2604086 RepID=UPI0011D2B358|nr:asparagine synthase-related protein [Aidingimonas lacisalsi]